MAAAIAVGLGVCVVVGGERARRKLTEESEGMAWFAATAPQFGAVLIFVGAASLLFGWD